MKEYHKESVLRRMYCEEGKSTTKIADEFSVTPSTIQRWMEKNGIERRDRNEAQRMAIWKNPASMYTRKDGYEYWKTLVRNEGKQLYVHRLMAVAEYGIEAVKDMHVHHKNGIPWDNRPENLELLSKSDHHRKHGVAFANSAEGIEKVRDKEWLEEHYKDRKMSLRDIKELTGISDPTIYEWLMRHGIETRSSTYRTDKNSEGRSG